jgi:hypothetical protein
MTARLASVLPYAAAFGATIVFFEMLTAQLPVAVGWLAAMVLAARRDDDRPGEVGAATVTLLAIVVFSVAAAATVIIKQVLAVSVAEPGAAAVFLEHLNLYMGRSEARGNWAEMLRPFGSLLEQSSVLTFGNTLAARVLMAGAGLAWLAAAIRGWYQRHSEQGRDVLLLLGVALVPVAWTLLLPTHTGGHAPFMVRMFVMPISVAPLALFWPAVDAPTPGDGDAHAGRGVHR